MRSGAAISDTSVPPGATGREWDSSGSPEASVAAPAVQTAPPPQAVDTRATGRAVVFVHIPKTAGMTLKKIVTRQCRYGEYMFLYETRIAQSVEKFRELPQDARRGYRFVLGHVGYGLHEFLPQPATYATILREPVERIVSYYYYILRTPEHFLYEPAKRLGLKEFARCDASHKLTNGQTKYLAELDGQEADGQTLQTVKQRLEREFSVVGLIERFDESLMLLRRVAGWGIPYYAKENVTRDRPPMSEIPRDALEVIAEHNQVDVELYAWAKERFEQTVQREGMWLKNQVAMLHMTNKIYRTYRKIRGRDSGD
jgi:hypothetical protein